jgi:hypothetical protein
MPPAAQTDVGWIPKEVKKKLKEQQRAEKTTQENGEAQTAEKVEGKSEEPADPQGTA